MINTEQHTPAAGAAQDESFQARVQPWMMACFGAAIAADGAERNHRFLEESLELVQACGCTPSEAHQLVDYVYGRPVGERAQEVGGVMVTLAALCLAQGLDMYAAGETELARIWTKVEAIRAKQAAKPKHSPLPAFAPPVAAGNMDMDALLTACETAYRTGPYHGFISSLNAIRACAASQREELLSTAIAADQARQRAEKAEADLNQANEWRASALAENMQSGARWAARVAELEAQLIRRRTPPSPETQQAIAAARAAGQSIAATPGGLVFMSDGAEAGNGELDCPACGGSGHAGDVPIGSAP